MYAREQALIATPVGWVLLHGRDRLETVRIGVEATAAQPGEGAAAEAARQLLAWFAGTRRTFDVPLAPAATPRGQALREAMCAVPYGATISYGALATRAGSGARAIGQACARNPLPLFVPCHRVLGARDIGHYSAGQGLATKTWLLTHERRCMEDAA